MKKKILLIIRGIETDNFGDIAINYTLTKLIKDRNNNVESSNYIQLFSNLKLYNLSIVKNLLKMIRIIRKRYDIIIIGGGQLLLSNKKFPFSFLTWILLAKIFSRSRIYLYGVGVSEKFSYTDRLCFKIGLSFVENIYVRDFYSKHNLELNYAKFSNVIPDVVSVIKNIYEPQSFHQYQNYTIFGITHFKSIARYGYLCNNEEEYLNSQAKLLLSKINTNKFILFSNTQSDYLYALKFKNYLKTLHNYDVNVYFPNSLADYVDLVRNSKLVISGRMHALIIAKSYDVDVTPITRNKKLENFVNEYLESWSHDINTKIINKTLDNLLVD